MQRKNSFNVELVGGSDFLYILGVGGEITVFDDANYLRSRLNMKQDFGKVGSHADDSRRRFGQRDRPSGVVDDGHRGGRLV